MATQQPKTVTLYRSAEAEVVLDREVGVVRFVRLTATLPPMPELRRIFGALVDSMDGLPRAELGLLIDTRAAIGRSDDDFEAMMAEFRPRFLGGWRRIAVLVRSAVGQLQVRRLGRSDGLLDRMHIGGDESEAAAFLRRP